MVLQRKQSSSPKSRVGAEGKLRIGILLTYPKLEQTKEELVGDKLFDSACPWLKDVDDKFLLERKWKYGWEKKRPDARGKYGVPTDVAIGYFIKNAVKGAEVDFILPHEISLKRLQSNHLNFLLIYDLLEAFHTDKTEGKKIYGTLRKCLAKAGNIYPPLEYQDLVYSKIKYYNFMKDHNISIAPTLTMTAEEYRALGNERAVKKVMEHVDAEEWNRFIAKPVYGQESKDVKFFEGAKSKRSLSAYLSRCMAKYPGIVMQKAIEGFGDNLQCPELRMFFCGNTYQYSACATNSFIICPTQEGGEFKTPLKRLKPVVQKMLSKIPKIVMPNGAQVPRLITRLDMGYKIDGRFHPFVNELEFVPSLYVENVAVPLVSKYIAGVGKQMVKITKMYVKKQPAKRSTHKLGVMKGRQLKKVTRQAGA